MAEIINLDDYRKTCDNCLYHKQSKNENFGVCTRPGGWEWDKHFSRCISFRWRNGRPGKKGDQHGTDSKGPTGGFSGGV